MLALLLLILFAWQFHVAREGLKRAAVVPTLQAQAPAWLQQALLWPPPGVSSPTQTPATSEGAGAAPTRSDAAQHAAAIDAATRDLAWFLGVGGAAWVLLVLLAGLLAARIVRPQREFAALAEQFASGQSPVLPACKDTDARRIVGALERLDQRARSGDEVVSQVVDTRVRLQAALAELEASRALVVEHDRRAQAAEVDLARELHDEVAEHLTAIQSMGLSIHRRIGTSQPALAQASQLVVEAAQRIEHALAGLQARVRPALADSGLPEALSELVARWRTQHPQASFTLRLGPGLEGASAEVAAAAYRIAQESLTNAVKHSGGNAIEVNLRRLDGSMILQVSDNGCGIEAADVERPGYGLQGIRERVEAVGGRLEIGAARQGGTVVRARLPMSIGQVPMTPDDDLDHSQADAQMPPSAAQGA